jgi:hypothetical protein
MMLPLVKFTKGVEANPLDELVESSNPDAGVAEIPAIKFVADIVMGIAFEGLP